ncbi:DUF1223 domain-containing protein [Chryseobacterium indologenes]|uniref:DUF1223 domain-containing protein n=1 Tax=Chryseobacterium indologenes TaxID=253 RepID=UPI001024222D|nr:DUF1223 domain-containing protein [Chryseobacterium indologenes]VFA41180.1 Uncharacterized secreted protein [Chryseobacterium indologenes]
MILKNLITAGTFTSLLFAAFAFAHTENTVQKDSDPASGTRGFAVLELFTSEGCSSCPPADDLMGKIEKEYSKQPVYILSYHVDYWNRLGWKDRFSNAGNSQRQQQYSRILRSQTYTPQLVVNGQTEFVGSDSNAIQSAIEKALFSSKNTEIGLNATVSGQQATVHYSTLSSDPANVLLINLVEKQSSTQVGKGENEGRHLHHWQIVHQQNSISLNRQNQGNTTFKLPEGFTPAQWEVIAFIQNPKTGKIFGSAQTQFN